MAKKKKTEPFTAAEQTEQDTLEQNVVAQEDAERDAKVAAVFENDSILVATGGTSDPLRGSESSVLVVDAPDPVDDGPRQVIPPARPVPVAEPEPAAKSAKETWQEEAAHVLRLLEMGDAVSPGELRRLLHQAVALVAKP